MSSVCDDNVNDDNDVDVDVKLFCLIKAGKCEYQVTYLPFTQSCLVVEQCFIVEF